MNGIDQIKSFTSGLTGENSALCAAENYSYVHAAFPNIKITQSGENKYVVTVTTGTMTHKYKCSVLIYSFRPQKVEVEASLCEIEGKYPNRFCEGTIIDLLCDSVYTTVKIHNDLKGRGIVYCLFLVLKLHMDSIDMNITDKLVCLDYYKQSGWSDQYFYVLKQLLALKDPNNPDYKVEKPKMKPVFEVYYGNSELYDTKEVEFTEFKSDEFRVNLLKAIQSTASAKVVAHVFGCYDFEKISINTFSAEILSYVRQSGQYNPFHVHHKELNDVYFYSIGHRVYSVCNKVTHVVEYVVHFKREEDVVTCVVSNSLYEKILAMEFKDQDNEPIISCGFPFDTQSINKLCRMCVIIAFSPIIL